MIFYCLGIDHNKTQLAIREFAYYRRLEILRFLNRLDSQAEVLFTCNRIEIYGVSSNQEALERDIQSFKSKFAPVFDQAYLKLGLSQVVNHGLRLACGLESQILAEKQILGQLESWIRKEPFSKLTKTIWLEVLAAAKELRQRLDLDRIQNSLASIVLEDLILNTGLSSKKVLVLGTGKVAKDFSETKFSDINLYFFARKKIKKARLLAKDSGAQAFLLEDLSREIVDSDCLIAATSSPHHILRKQFLAKATGFRKQPLYIYDLAMPRDIQPQAGEISGVVLKNLEDLAENFRRHNETVFKGRQSAQSVSFAPG